VFFDEQDPEDDDVDLEQVSEAEELQGKLASDPDEQRLAHSVVENDEQTVADGQVLEQSVDYNLGTFTPDLMFEKLVTDYRDAVRLFGPTIIRELTGYEGGFIEKNVKIREFREELKKNLHRNIDRLKKDGLLDKDGTVTDDGMRLAKLVLYTEELDHLKTKGLGHTEKKERSHYGDPDQIVPYVHQRYKDVDVRASIQCAVRRGHDTLVKEDLRAVTRKQHGRIAIIYALDASGSMRGAKIHTSKKAGIALAFRAIQDRNDVGLVVFTSKVERSIPPTRDFAMILDELSKARAGQETDIGLVIDHATSLFNRNTQTKHLILITDALATRGEDPARIAREAASAARTAGVTLSIVGINLETEGEQLARELVELGDGKLYRVNHLEEMDLLMLDEYDRISR
jgi:Mg-chelatase subunit ChlD